MLKRFPTEAFSLAAACSIERGVGNRGLAGSPKASRETTIPSELNESAMDSTYLLSDSLTSSVVPSAASMSRFKAPFLTNLAGNADKGKRPGSNTAVSAKTS